MEIIETCKEKLRRKHRCRREREIDLEIIKGYKDYALNILKLHLEVLEAMKKAGAFERIKELQQKKEI